MRTRLAIGFVSVALTALVLCAPTIRAADAIDPAGQMEFGAEGGLEKSVDDFAVGESLPLGALARGDGRVFGG